MHQWRSTTLDSDRHTWLPMRRRQGCKPAEPDTTGEPQTEERKPCKVRHCTACMSAALSIVAPHSDLDGVQDSQVSCAACPLYTGLSWLAPRSGTSSWTAQWGFLFRLSPNFSKKNIQTMNYHSFICQTTSQTAVCFCRLLYLVHFTPILRC